VNPELVQDPATGSSEEPHPLGDFLRTRRARIQPERVGIPRTASRRVQGLRRDEVANRASVSQEYYLRLEQGRDRDPSDQVLDGIARALLLDTIEQDYLFRIARLSSTHRPEDLAGPDHSSILEEMSRMLALWPATPAMVTTANQDVVLVNELMEAIGGRWLVPGHNLVELIFSSPRRGLPGWEKDAAAAVAALRFYGDPFDERLRQVVGGLSVRYEEFRQIWGRHDVAVTVTGRVAMRDRAGGRLEYTFHNFDMPYPQGYRVTAFNPITR